MYELQKDREQAAFEDWLARECPSGDVTEVQRQWETSHALQSFIDSEIDRECDVQPLGLPQDGRRHCRGARHQSTDSPAPCD